ncbi:tRNA1(Val) (adenine(37)-N6)-methyltransferase [Pedobacter frigidisoli]|uniref:tRNA1(Val) (adenine(37)-N6)-methyltransferase n=1 Tax=Pedobacter frigidisoli TaxID=2530455 RepID=UPI00292E92DE|nr:methyltransferase [Pedobacter frigidisoli]
MSSFKFKQFEINQSGCAMKINTDGVLLGAMAAHAMPRRILDIGTGTGVIALMLAQRFPGAFVEAVEIDQQASETAAQNFMNSSFAGRLNCNHIAIEAYDDAGEFDLIVSNPPFFVNDMKSEEKRKEIARHTDSLFFAALVYKISNLLADDGLFWLVLPVKQAAEVAAIAIDYDIFLTSRINLRSDETKPAFRQIICFGRKASELVETDFFIYDGPRQHTLAYQEVLRDFFLAY